MFIKFFAILLFMGAASALPVTVPQEGSEMMLDTSFQFHKQDSATEAGTDGSDVEAHNTIDDTNYATSDIESATTITVNHDEAVAAAEAARLIEYKLAKSNAGTTPTPTAEAAADQEKINLIRWQIGLIVLVSLVAAMAAGHVMSWLHNTYPLKGSYEPDDLHTTESGHSADKKVVLLSDQPSINQPLAPPPSYADCVAETEDKSETLIKAQGDDKGKVDEKDKLLQTIKTEWIIRSVVPYWFLPAAVVFLVIGTVFVLPEINTLVTPYTEKMSKLLALYLVIDLAALRWLLGIMNWGVLRWKNFSQHEIERLAGPFPEIPTKEWMNRGGGALYQMDSYARKIPHVLHWAGLAWFVVNASDTPWGRFQFSVMGATADIILLWTFCRTTAFVPNMLVWLASCRTNDGFARRMNLVYCKCSSVIGMGVTVPLSAWLLSRAFGEQHHAAFLFIVTLPCAYGDCLAEIIGVNGRLRFDVCGLGERNNKSIEGMLAMFLGSVLPCLPYREAVGGWPYLLIVGVFATIAETWTPRGFDNVSIPLASALGACIACYCVQWTQGGQLDSSVDGISAQVLHNTTFG